MFGKNKKQTKNKWFSTLVIVLDRIFIDNLARFNSARSTEGSVGRGGVPRDNWSLHLRLGVRLYLASVRGGRAGWPVDPRRGPGPAAFGDRRRWTGVGQRPRRDGLLRHRRKPAPSRPARWRRTACADGGCTPGRVLHRLLLHWTRGVRCGACLTHFSSVFQNSYTNSAIRRHAG